MSGGSPRRAENLPANQLVCRGLPAARWPRDEKVRRVSLQRKMRKGVNDRRRHQQFSKRMRLVRFKPNRHENPLESKVFELCEACWSLCVQALGAVASKFHENTRTAALAADSVAFPVKGFKTAAVGAFVVNEFNHGSLSSLRDRASCFEPFSTPSACFATDEGGHQLNGVRGLKFH